MFLFIVIKRLFILMCIHTWIEPWDATAFLEFRNCNLIAASQDYARAEDFCALEVRFCKTQKKKNKIFVGDALIIISSRYCCSIIAKYFSLIGWIFCVVYQKPQSQRSSNPCFLLLSCTDCSPNQKKGLCEPKLCRYWIFCLLLYMYF